MTLFQARYVQWLTLIGCSLRATAGHYYGRYNFDNTNKNTPNDYNGCGGNQLDGIFLRKEAIKVLTENGIDPVISEMDNNIGYDADSYLKWRGRS